LEVRGLDQADIGVIAVLDDFLLIGEAPLASALEDNLSSVRNFNGFDAPIQKRQFWNPFTPCCSLGNDVTFDAAVDGGPFSGWIWVCIK
jgi:hypothetical protein